jgi:hypothetical protein
MITEDTPLLPKESLDVITDAINRTKENFRGNSFYFLLWGWLIALASLGFFLLHEYTRFEYYFLPFPVLVVTGICLSVDRYLKARSHSRTESYLDYFFNRMWLVLGIGFIVTVFVTVSQNLWPFSYALVLAGVGTLVSGLAMNFKPLTTGGILFFAVAVVSVFIPDGYKPLLFGVAIIAGYLVPGYLLRSSHTESR